MASSGEAGSAEACRAHAAGQRPKLEVADVFRRYGPAYREMYGAGLSDAQDRVLRELAACRTGVLGGHVNQCRRCGHRRQAYNSCGNRLCPKCRGKRRTAWYLRRGHEMLPVEYLHVVFTVPDEIARLTRQNPKLLYDLLFEAAAYAILRVGRECYGAELGLCIHLHSWGQLLNGHPHGHCVLPAGGLALGDGRWVSLPPGDTLPKDLLREFFQRKFLKKLRWMYRADRLVLREELARLQDPKAFQAWHDALAKRRWVVYANAAQECGDPRDPGQPGQPGQPGHGERIVRYLARYVSGMVFSNHRLISIDDGLISFFYKDYRDGNRSKVMTLPAMEFIDRFLTHVLPARMQHTRYYGFQALRCRGAKLQAIRQMLGCSPSEDPQEKEAQAEGVDKFSGDSDALAADALPADGEPDEIEAEGIPCPACGHGRMVRGMETPRPTVPEILRMPFPDEKVVRACVNEFFDLFMQPYPLFAAAGWDATEASACPPSALSCAGPTAAPRVAPTATPSAELRQRLLVSAFT